MWPRDSQPNIHVFETCSVLSNLNYVCTFKNHEITLIGPNVYVLKKKLEDLVTLSPHSSAAPPDGS